MHPGLREAIIDADLFERVQQSLTSNRVVRTEDQQSEPSPLAGLVQDEQGNKFTPAHARGKNGRRHRYYVAQYLQTGIATGKSSDSVIRRVPATVIEELVIGRLRSLMGHPVLQWNAAVLLIRRLELHRMAIILHLSLPEHCGWQDRMDDGDRWHLDEHGLPVITIPGRLKLCGGRTMLIAPAGQGVTNRARPDQALIAGLKRAHVELAQHNIHLRKSDGNLVDAKGIGDPYLRRLASLAFLAPDIQRAILDGRHPHGLRLQQLVMNDIPLDWNAQRRAVGFAT